MKIPFKFQDIDSLDHATYINKFKAGIKKLKPKANTPETAVTVFINQEFEFAAGTVEALIIVGTPSGPWKKWLKDSVKANKKMTIIGKGYVATDDSGGDVLKFVRLKGNAKLDKVTKAAKNVLKKAQMSLSEVQSLTDKVVSQDDQDFMKNLSGEGEEPSEDKKEDPNVKLEQAKTLIQEIAATQLDIKNHLGQVKAIAAKGDMSALLAKIGMILTLEDIMQTKIDALRALGIANSRADKFAENLKKIKELTEKNFSKKKAEVAAIEEDLRTMITAINTKIEEFDANVGYKIQL